MFRATYPGADPDAETFASFRAAVDAIPRRTKRLWNYAVFDDDREEYEAAEIARLENYCDFSRPPFG